MTLLDAIRSLAQRLAYRDLGWPAAVREHVRAGVDPALLARARDELGDEWAGEVYAAARAEASQPVELVMDDATEIGDLPGQGWTAGQLHRMLGRAILADPDVAAMLVIAGGAEVHSVEVGVVREPALAEDDYVVVVR